LIAKKTSTKIMIVIGFTITNKKSDRTTGVWQDCEFCSKFTFISRKKFYL
jgi:hypothetical protein